MERALFHVFTNSAVGRERLLQSAYLAERFASQSLAVFIPNSDKMVVYCDRTVLTLSLDGSCERCQSAARDHAADVLKRFEVHYEIYEPRSFTGGVLPEVADDWTLFTCPRSVSEKSGRIGLRKIGLKLRSLLVHAPFPVFLPADTFKAWSRIAVLFADPNHAATTYRIGAQLASRAGVPLEIYTQLSDTAVRQRQSAGATRGPERRVQREEARWHRWEGGVLEDHLYDVPGDSLVVVDAGNDSLVQELVFGSVLERIQTNLPNPLIVCGPRCESRLRF